MAGIKIHEQLSWLRKQKGVTQEDLARVFGITNQAISKWESGACCPDIALLPDIADFFEVSLDTLFGRTPAPKSEAISVGCVPWDNDDTLHAAVFLGRKLLSKAADLSQFTFVLEGDAKSVECGCNLTCGNVNGIAFAGGNLHCGDIGGGVNAGGNVKCGRVGGGVNAGGTVNCESHS